VLYLVRHAKAGSRFDWNGDDRLRPLTKPGRRQADTLAARLAALATGELISSPYLRCVETLQPLAERLQRGVRTDDRLAEGQRFSGALELLDEVADGAVLCSHGDVIPDTIDALQRRGCEVVGEPDWRKGSVWVLERAEHGAVVSASCWPAPDD